MSADLVQELRLVPVLHDLPEEQLAWFAAQCRVVDYQPGDVIVQEGDPADTMFVLLAGETQTRRDKTAVDGRVVVNRAGDITGMLPFSRLTHFPVTARAVARTRIAFFPAAQFPEMLQRIPELGARLVATLSDRVRQTTRFDEQREKLISLGRLSAGLAHELNNPAAAVRRGTSQLRSALTDAQAWTARLARQTDEATIEQLGALASTVDPATAARLSPLERSDREEEIGAWLEARGVDDAWEIAPTLTEAGVEVAWLERFGETTPDDALPLALRWLEATLRAEELLRTVEQASARISTLVGAVKGYTFMDQAPLQEVDVHAGLDSTLQVLAHKLQGITVTRDYAPDLPRVQAYGAELNQVWTNLIDNAADAVGRGGHIALHTRSDGDGVRVEILDDGPGIPPEIQPRIFDPFFTTKEVGRGTGLGLDITRRIIEQHQGSIHVESQPGNTRFVVRLPVAGPHW